LKSSAPLWSVYFIRTTRGELYAGVTTDVARRLAQHREGRGAKFLRGRGALVLVYRRRIGERGLALSVERRLKRLAKPAKEALVDAKPATSQLLRRLGLERRNRAAQAKAAR
jgi:putative endonuclease